MVLLTDNWTIENLLIHSIPPESFTLSWYIYSSSQISLTFSCQQYTGFLTQMQTIVNQLDPLRTSSPAPPQGSSSALTSSVWTWLNLELTPDPSHAPHFHSLVISHPSHLTKASEYLGPFCHLFLKTDHLLILVIMGKYWCCQRPHLYLILD